MGDLCLNSQGWPSMLLNKPGTQEQRQELLSKGEDLKPSFVLVNDKVPWKKG